MQSQNFYLSEVEKSRAMTEMNERMKKKRKIEEVLYPAELVEQLKNKDDQIKALENQNATMLAELAEEFAFQASAKRVTNYNVKAVEYFLKQKCESHPEIAKVLEFFHFSCTSEDINNLSHGLMLQEALSSVILPAMDDLIKSISLMAKEFAYVPMLSRTHGQVKSPEKSVYLFC
ncbi:PREDICTED: adenylosuccinate lyase-like [Brassica oleracea var. oleracea]|uniref:Fumarate lyase N-terminal domain-containing protein n=1 Tax=Brassica oleracea var. oleracea TaxID=109376 RepID=A0A0D3AJ21_BRAOL|nr:PREDICTED: adenylosuccinate lyase-like [Brassica oleracea var. oleracea]